MSADTATAAAAPTARQPTGRAAVLARDRQRAGRRRLRAAGGAAAAAQPGAAVGPAPAAPAGGRLDRRRDHGLVAGGAGRAVADRPGDRQRDTAAGEVGQRRAAAGDRGAVRGDGGRAGGDDQDVRHHDRADRPGGGARAAPAAVRAPAQPVGLVPRELHVGAGDLAADVGRGGDLGAVRGGTRRAHHRGADAAPGRHRHAAARLAAGAGGALRLRAADLAERLVPAELGHRLPAHQGDERAGHRVLRGDLRRAAGGPGVPPGGAELGDLRPAVG